VPGATRWIKTELQALRYPVVAESPASIETKGTLEDCQWLNLQLRTANSVLWHMAEFKAKNADELYREARKLPWEKYIGPDGYLSIDAFVRNPTIKDFRFASLRLKDALVDRMQALYNRRPDSGKEKDRSVIFLYWTNDKVQLWWDTSGETLAKRGYRLNPWKAPLMENTAAGIVQDTGWDGRMPLVNPMCGSGTLAIEAALLATNTAPGIFRENYGFMHLLPYRKSEWTKQLGVARRQRQPLKYQIWASDIEGGALKASRQNAEAAGVSGNIQLEQADYSKVQLPKAPAKLIMNPEWGARLGDTEELKSTYKEIGDFMKSRLAGYSAYLVLGNPALGKEIGLRTKHKIEVPLSQLDGRLYEYELYAGSKKDKN
jgi:putative N6-adenine-specific DNA methylase